MLADTNCGNQSLSSIFFAHCSLYPTHLSLLGPPSPGLCTIPRVDVLASTAFDGTLRLWDLYRMCERKQLSGGHRKAVCSLDYSDEYRLLVTASFDHDVCVWSPYADKLIYKMKGMRSILCG